MTPAPLRPARQQVDVRPLDQSIPGDAEPIHQVPGDAGPLILRLLGPQDHLQLDELAQALHVVEVDPCLTDPVEPPPLAATSLRW